MNRDAASCEGRPCNFKLEYWYDERGLLTRARRSDAATPFDSAGASPDSTTALEIRYRYSDGVRTYRETTVGGETYYDIDIFGSLALHEASFVEGDYESTAYTQRVTMPGATLAYGESGLPRGSSDSSPDLRRLYFHINDHLGSPSFVLEASTSEVVEARTYDAYGRTESDFRPERWKGHHQRRHFTGHDDDEEVGLVYAGARYYAPALGVFTTPDPLVQTTGAGDLNVYAYVRGRTFTHIDPLGLQEYCSVAGDCKLVTPRPGTSCARACARVPRA